MISRYKYRTNEKTVREIVKLLHAKAKRVVPTADPDLIAVNNGIFDYKKKCMLPFSPDYVFMSKSRVDYNPNAKNVVIHNPSDNTDWDVESWMNTLSDDPEIVAVLWEILGAIIRPNVPWNISAWFFSETGNNGKGTLCELMRQLCGEGSYCSISLKSMGKDFALEELVHSSAIITDENAVGVYIDDAANLKAIITNDVLQINRKFKQAITYRFRGFMVQCLNEMPRIKDKSDSFFRRQLFIPFTKCFTGMERKYIKTDYLHRKEVLEYVMKRVLESDYYSLSVPAACVDALEQYREYNDPVRRFAMEVVAQMKWKLLPYTFLYDAYKAWYRQEEESGQIMGANAFRVQIRAVLAGNARYAIPDQRKKIRPRHYMDDLEPLIEEYDLKDWMNPYYAGSPDVDKRCKPVLRDYYRGIMVDGVQVEECEDEGSGDEGSGEQSQEE